MYKRASANSQSRARRSVVESHRNDNIDGSVFRDTVDLEWDRVVSRKRIVEAGLSDLNARIQRAKAEVYTKNNFVKPATFQRWHTDRAKLVEEMALLDSQLGILRSERRKAHVEDARSFEVCFTEAAQLMLADAVYHRIKVAALHLMTEAPQKVA